MTAVLAQTKQYPLSFWQRLQARLDEAFAGKEHTLSELLTPIEATLIDVNAAKQRASVARDEALVLMAEMETMQFLIQLVANQVSYASFDVRLPSYERQAVSFRKILNHRKRHLSNLPSRERTEALLNKAHTDYESSKLQGNGDSATAERARLRAIKENVYILGREDLPNADSVRQLLETDIDNLETKIQSLLNNTRINIQIPEIEMVRMLANFGVQLEEPVAPSESTPIASIGNPPVDKDADITERMD